MKATKIDAIGAIAQIGNMLFVSVKMINVKQMVIKRHITNAYHFLIHYPKMAI